MRRGRRKGPPVPSPRPARVTVLDYDEHALEDREIATPKECVPFKETPTVTWINVDGLRPELIESLSACYGIHPLVLEDIRDLDQRPTYEEYGEYIYLSVKMLGYGSGKGVTEEKVSMILGANFLITFQEEKPGDVFDAVRAKIRQNKGRIRKLGPDYLAYELLDAIVDNYFTILEKVGEEVERIEDLLVERPQPDVLLRINELKKDMLFVRRAVWPLRESISNLSRSDSPLIKEPTVIYFRDVYDHTVHAIDTLETYRDFIAGMIDIYLSSVSYRLNEIMKVLTIIATIFIPLTFIAGIYGMNFDTAASRFNMPELNWRFGYPFVLSVMAAAAAAMLAYFKRKKWF